MAFVILVLAICASTVFITLGSWSKLVRTPLHARWLLIPIIAIPIALKVIDLPEDQVASLGFGLYLGAYGLLLIFCLLNLSVRGMAVVAIGVALNAVVIGLNRGMPTRAVDGQPVEASALHKPEASTDLLPWLGDIIVLPITRETISFGDLIVGVGLVNVVFWASRERKRHSTDSREIDISTVLGPHDDLDTLLGSTTATAAAGTGELRGPSDIGLASLSPEPEPEPEPASEPRA
jgi:hypothetical protein